MTLDIKAESIMMDMCFGLMKYFNQNGEHVIKLKKGYYDAQRSFPFTFAGLDYCITPLIDRREQIIKLDTFRLYTVDGMIRKMDLSTDREKNMASSFFCTLNQLENKSEFYFHNPGDRVDLTTVQILYFEMFSQKLYH